MADTDREAEMSPQKGFSEEPRTFEDQSAELASVGFTRLKVGDAGRIVIPAEMRAAMMVKPGDTVTAQVVDGELRIVSRPVVLARIRAEAAKFKAAHPGISVVDELIQERREEARKELEEANVWRKAHGLPPFESE
jgi:AbrB family looped-hinge helix DNA binding protein